MHRHRGRPSRLGDRPVSEAVWKTVDISREGPVIVVTIFRPERRNAVDSATAAALLSAFAAFEEDDSASRSPSSPARAGRSVPGPT